jgi:hypothetical protein
MIRYALACDNDHEFEAWFSTSDDYDAQVVRGLVECPFCASRGVKKQIMAPAVSGTRDGPRPADMQAMMMRAMGEMRRHVETNFDHVGDRFAVEARAIHEGEARERPIYGQATKAEVKALVEDGVPVSPLPPAATPRRREEVN